MNVQIISKDGVPEWAVISYETYMNLMEKAEMLDDIQAYDEAKAAIATGEELVPAEVVFAILEGQNPIRVWREYRGLTQRELAEKAGISKPYLSQIEAGKRKGSAAVLSALASALGLTLDNLVATDER